MTTKVKVEIVQENVPVVIEVLNGGGNVAQTHTIRVVGDSYSEYVHSGQTLRVREMTTEELHNGFVP